MEIMKPQEVAELFNVTVRSLKNWDDKGVLPAMRTITGRRYYDKAVVIALHQKMSEDNEKRLKGE